MNRFYVDGAYEARGPLGAYCIVVCKTGKPANWFVQSVEPHLAAHVELEGLRAAITLASTNLPAQVFSDSVNSIKRCSEWAKRLNVELKHIPGHLSGKTDVEVTDDVKKHHWADTQARGFIQSLLKDYNDTGNRIRGLDKLINKSV